MWMEVKPLDMSNPAKQSMNIVTVLFVRLRASKSGTGNSVQLKPKKIRNRAASGIRSGRQTEHGGCGG